MKTHWQEDAERAERLLALAVAAAKVSPAEAASALYEAVVYATRAAMELDKERVGE